MQANIGERVVVDGHECLGDSVDESVRANEADARVGLRLRDQMFGAAEADFEAHVIGRAGKQRAQIGRRGLAGIKGNARQQRLKQRRLPRPQRMALAPPEEGAL